MAIDFARAFVDSAAFVPPPPPGGTMPALIGNYAIRDDDLSLFDCLVAVLVAGAPVGFFLHPSQVTTAAIVGAVGGVGKTLRDLRVKSAWLDQARVRILTILKANVTEATDQGLMDEDILKIVQRTTPELDLEWVRKRLNELTKVPVRGGGVKDFVVQSPNGEWRSLV